MAMTRPAFVRPFPHVTRQPRVSLSAWWVLAQAIMILILIAAMLTAAYSQTTPRPWAPAPRAAKHSPKRVPVASASGCADWLAYKDKLETLASNLVHLHRVGLVPGDRVKGATGDDVEDSLQEAAAILKAQAVIIGRVVCGEAQK